MCCQETFRRQENQQQRSLLPNHEVPVVLISYTVKLVEEFVPNTASPSANRSWISPWKRRGDLWPPPNTSPFLSPEFMVTHEVD